MKYTLYSQHFAGMLGLIRSGMPRNRAERRKFEHIRKAARRYCAWADKRYHHAAGTVQDRMMADIRIALNPLAGAT